MDGFIDKLGIPIHIPSFLTGPLYEYEKTYGYPEGKGSPVPPENQGGPDNDLCTKDGPQSYEDENVKITCEHETKACPAGQTGEVTEYYRKTEYLTTPQRYFTFGEGFV